LALKLLTLNDLERHNGRFFALSYPKSGHVTITTEM